MSKYQRKANQSEPPLFWRDVRDSPLRRTAIVHIAALAIALLAHVLLGFIEGSSQPLLFGLGSGILWITIESFPQLNRLAGLPLASQTLFTAIEVSRYRAPWLILGLGAGIVAWDTYHFLKRGQQVGHIEEPEDLESLHLRRLLIFSAAGSAVGIIAMSVSFSLDLGSILVLGLLAILGISQGVRYLRSPTG